MPLSAKSPTGPISLVGMDIRTIENLKERNRTERLFVAKCCGEPVQIRVPPGKVPHFYHLSTSPDCVGGKGESQQHLSLKSQIAEAVLAAGWSVEVEAEHRLADGTLIWRADVLAKRGNANVAFEVELSKPDWSTMQERQKRYKQYGGVRGLWFVKTKKPFPVDESLPLFSLVQTSDGWQIDLKHPNDWPDEWSRRYGQFDLAAFVYRALGGDLKWARLTKLGNVSAELQARVLGSGSCSSCGRAVGHVYALSMNIPKYPELPPFVWHQGMTHRRTFWVEKVLELTQPRLSPSQAGFVSRTKHTCMACGSRPEIKERQDFPPLTKAQLDIGELPQPRLGTIEWDWVNRWTLSAPSSPDTRALASTLA